MTPVATREVIESVVEALPIQNRIMIRLLLLQYLDLTQEDIDYMATDRPDPRFQQGQAPKRHVVTREAVGSITDRAEQYRTQVRQKRERTWLQIECLRKQISLTEALCGVAEHLLTSRFDYSTDTVTDLKNGARGAVPRPAIRALEKKWEKEEVTEEEFLKERLPIEYQTVCRRLDRYRRRLGIAKREFATLCAVPLQDHEIAHIWGIPLSSLAARKVKALHQYLQTLQGKTQDPHATQSDAPAAPVDPWKETFTALTASPVQRSVSVYDGMEGTEAALLDKLLAFATGSLPDDNENRLWQAISRDYSPNAIEGQGKRQSLFALQRLSALISDMDTSPDQLEQDLLAKYTPPRKAVPGETPEPTPEPVPQLGEMAEHVLRSLRGEERS